MARTPTGIGSLSALKLQQMTNFSYLVTEPIERVLAETNSEHIPATDRQIRDSVIVRLHDFVLRVGKVLVPEGVEVDEPDPDVGSSHPGE